MQNHLCNRFQRIKVHGSFSDWTEILAGVPEVSILGLWLFNIFSNDTFLFTTNSNLCKYADGNTLYAINKNLLHVEKPALEAKFDIMQKWFFENHMVYNPRKYY